MNRVDLTGVAWFKSSYSNGQAECVEVARTGKGIVPARDSKDPSGPILTFSAPSWGAFIESVKDKGLTGF